jgi:hypothetical protein
MRIQTTDTANGKLAGVNVHVLIHTILPIPTPVGIPINIAGPDGYVDGVTNSEGIFDVNADAIISGGRVEATKGLLYAEKEFKAGCGSVGPCSGVGTITLVLQSQPTVALAQQAKLTVAKITGAIRDNVFSVLIIIGGVIVLIWLGRSLIGRGASKAKEAINTIIGRLKY